MSVYVDLPMWYPYQNRKWAHLIADTEEELHEFADKLGLKRAWFQNKKPKKIPHYDIVESKWRKAKETGAIFMDRNQFAQFMKNYKEFGMINPETKKGE